MNSIPVIHAVGTAVPSRTIRQSKMLSSILLRLPEDKRLRYLITRLYLQSGIETRHTVIPDFMNISGNSAFIPEEVRVEEGPPTSYRNSLFSSEAPELAQSAVNNLFAQLPSVAPGMVTHLISASCTGFSAPSFDLELIKRTGLPADTERCHIGFMGCLAAFPALRLAKSICLAAPVSRVLVVCNELCSLHYHHRFDTNSLIANSIFADGCGAALVSSNPSDGNGHGLALQAFHPELIAGTEKDMSWLISDHGFEMTLSQSVPRIIEANIKSLLEHVVHKANLAPDLIDNWAIHPGGRAILDFASKGLGINQSALEDSYAVLRDFGNMSSPTILFVLARILKKHSGGPLFAASFGPGLTAETAILEVF